MKKPVVDYREFRLSRLNESRFSHLKLLAGWIFYFVAYFITENLMKTSLPDFLVAFSRRKKLSNIEIDELHRIIDDMRRR